MKKIFILTMLLISLNNVFSQQIAYEIKEVKVSGNLIPNGAAIEFGSNSSVTVKFKFNLQKLTTLQLGMFLM